MTPVTSRLLSGIRDDDAESMLGAAEFAQAFRFGTGANAGLIEPYAQLLVEHPPTSEDAAALKVALVDYLSSTSRCNAAAAVFALGKFEDPLQVELLRSLLREQVASISCDSMVLGNLICALHNIGERVITSGRFDASEIEANIAFSREYLERATSEAQGE
jgi:hypothetical protein